MWKNLIISNLKENKPIFYESTNNLTYENGKKMAFSWADYIRLDLEHGPFTFDGINKFMLGLTSYLKTPRPTVIAELPFPGDCVESVKANSWIARQILNFGVDGLILCHAECPDAIKEVVKQIRYQLPDNKNGELIGKRGHGGEKQASKFLSISESEYINQADLWPLNPNGKLILGLKIENKKAFDRCEQIVCVKGIGFAEWGLGDMALCHGYTKRPTYPLPKELEEVRKKIWDLCNSKQIPFLDILDPSNFKRDFDYGMKIFRTYDKILANKIRIELGKK